MMAAVRRRSRDSAALGCRLELNTCTQEGRKRRLRYHVEQKLPRREGTAETLPKTVRKLTRGLKLEELAGLLSGVANSHRLAILYRLLQGPTSYPDLQAASGLNAGPLYHHIASLRLAGLVAPKRRNCYEITDFGERVALLLTALPKLQRTPRR